MGPHLSNDNPMASVSCTRCGKCCEKGGPAIHLEDKALIENGNLALKHLFTIRRGEPAYDNIDSHVAPQQTDIIKIKSVKDTPVCLFFDEKCHACQIYSHRPVECRVLKCWDTRDIRNMYRKNRLTRFDILGNVVGLWDLVDEHQRTCSVDVILDFINDVRRSGKKDPGLEKKVRYIIRYDMEIRSLIAEKNSIAPDILDFLFGRPVIDTLPALGLSARYQNEKLILTINP